MTLYGKTEGVGFSLNQKKDRAFWPCRRGQQDPGGKTGESPGPVPRRVTFAMLGSAGTRPGFTVGEMFCWELLGGLIGSGFCHFFGFNK